ncbi:hypothetical protein BpHYR1_007823 [Brachionus plicatilis]|uniref:Uncharacterized protein n=1 Tax=Brachionus plicatilis TaxID=10195 RepID=A0A3M7T4L1_BRAPC|nr:hypothetical protein BpHYR1_007823 [Brachionus plicatilis]
MDEAGIMFKIAYLFNIYHDSNTAGHQETIFDYCKTCDTCQKLKPNNTARKNPMVTIKVDNS